MVKRIFLGLLGLALTCSIQVQAHAQSFGLGTMSQGSINYAIGSAIASALDSKGGIKTVIQPASGTSSFLPLIDGGELDFGVANFVETQRAVEGHGVYLGRKLPNIRLAAVLFPIRVAVFVRADSEITSLSDLKGKRVTFGFTSQEGANDIFLALLANGGIGEKDFKPVLVPSVVRGAEEFAAGRADAFFFALGAAKTSEVHASVGGLRALPLSDAPEAVAAMRKLLPAAYLINVQPDPSLAGVEVPTTTMAHDYVLLAGKHVAAATVEKAVQTLATHKDDLVATLKAFAAFNPQRTRGGILPYHQGALDYYAKAGIQVN